MSRGWGTWIETFDTNKCFQLIGRLESVRMIEVL